MSRKKEVEKFPNFPAKKNAFSSQDIKTLTKISILCGITPQYYQTTGAIYLFFHKLYIHEDTIEGLGNRRQTMMEHNRNDTRIREDNMSRTGKSCILCDETFF